MTSTKLTKTKAVLKALIKSKPTYALLGVILTALGYASGASIASKIEMVMSVLLGMPIS